MSRYVAQGFSLEPNDAEKVMKFELGSRKTVDIKDPERNTLRDHEMDYPNRSNTG
jgi:hypothetical protein